MNTQLENSISAARHELNKLIEIRDALTELILEVSRRLDVLIVEHTKNFDSKEG